MKKTLTLILFTTTFYSEAQIDGPTCGTPLGCYELRRQEKAEALRLKEDREEAAFRQRQLELENAQLRELQEQRAVLEEELASQQRMEELRMKEIEEAEREKRLKTEQ